MRRVNTAVFPDPAPATISSGVPWCATAARCCGFRPSSKASLCELESLGMSKSAGSGRADEPLERRESGVAMTDLTYR